MYRLMLCALLGAVPVLVSANANLPTGDLKGSMDPAGLGRYDGSFIVEYQTGAYDEVTLPVSVLEKAEPEQRDPKNNVVHAPRQKLDLEGKVTRTVYLLPEGRSPLEVLRNYQQIIKDKGGVVSAFYLSNVEMYLMQDGLMTAQLLGSDGDLRARRAHVRICIIGLAMVEKDGLAVLVGFAVGAFSLVVAGTVVIGLLHAFFLLLSSLAP